MSQTTEESTVSVDYDRDEMADDATTSNNDRCRSVLAADDRDREVSMSVDWDGESNDSGTVAVCTANGDWKDDADRRHPNTKKSSQGNPSISRPGDRGGG